MPEPKLNKKLFFIFAAALSCVLVFQNCGDIKVAQIPAPPQPSIQAKGISGRICASESAVNVVSRYTLDRFLILNMTSVPKDGVTEVDADTNGVIDRIDASPSSIATIALTNTDSDADGVPDFIESIRGLTSSRNDLFEDGSDQDAIFNYDELVRGSDPTSGADPAELNLYSVAADAVESGCDPSQLTYKFNVQNLQRVSVPAFNDSVNLNAASLSHAEDENVYLIYAHMQPERITEPTRKLYKVFKVHKDDENFYLDLKISDFEELPAP